MIDIPSWPSVSLWTKEKKCNLEHIYRILEKLANPHKKLPKTIHIAGTNGKGSSQAFLKNIFTCAGFKVHSYTSPHLIEFNERIILAGNPISDDHLIDLLSRVKYASNCLGIEPSFFEGITLAAFLAFAETKADVLILETGLGGRLDCTNVIENPIATLITPISYDHTAYLGGTLNAIAIEKAGIIKRGAPCIVSAQTEEVYSVIIEKCEEIEAPCFCYEYDYGVNILSDGFEYKSEKYYLKFPCPSLLGDHQILNAAAVVATTMMVNDHFNITSKQIVEGLINTKWPGRIEKIETALYSHLAGGNIQIYIDGAHNNAGAMVLADWARSNLNGPVYLILGMTKDRNPIEFCSYFNDFIKEGRAVSVISEPSSYVSSIISPLASRSGIAFKESSSLTEAIKELEILNNHEAANILITGSLFLVADFLKLIKNK